MYHVAEESKIGYSKLQKPDISQKHEKSHQSKGET